VGGPWGYPAVRDDSLLYWYKRTAARIIREQSAAR
jgi:hypothetical protein